MPESFDETRYHGLLYFQKIDSYFMLKKASNIVDIIAGLDNISTANNMFPMYIQAYSPYYQMYIRFICRQPLVVDIFLFVILFHSWRIDVDEQRFSDFSFANSHSNIYFSF